MGEFDDVLAMEPGDEWDDYESGLAPSPDLAALTAELQVPGVRVQVRGSVPASVLAALAPLLVAPGSEAGADRVATLTVVEDGGAHRVEDLDAGSLGSVRTEAELLDLLVERLLDISETFDRRNVHLRCAVLAFEGGHGVLLIDPDPASRHRNVTALVAEGAECRGVDRAVLIPGTRTVLPFPTPILVHRADSDGDRRPRVALRSPPAASLGPTRITAVLVVQHEEPATVPPGRSGTDDDEMHGTSVAPEPLGSPHGCARLFVDGAASSSDPHQLLGAVVDLSAAVQFWSVSTAALDEVADTLRETVVPSPHGVAVTRHLREDDPDVVVVRFDVGGVLADVERGVAFELDDDELPVVDRLGWPSLTNDRVVEAAVLDAWAGAGIDLRPTSLRTRARVPGPASFGLPDSPVGDAARKAWSTSMAASLLSDDPTCALALHGAMSRGDLVADGPLASAVESVAATATDRADAAHRTLDVVEGHLGGSGIVALVLGRIVGGLDGPLPGSLVDVDRVELLVAPDQVRTCVELLVDAGVATEVDDVEVEVDPDGGRPRRLIGELADTPIVIHDRLAGGPFGELVDHEELHRRSVPVPFRGRWLRALHPDDRFVWACVRLDAAERPGIAEVREVAESAPRSRAGMAAVMEASERWGATRTVLSAMRTTDEVVSGLSPWLAERAHRRSDGPSRRRRRQVRRI